MTTTTNITAPQVASDSPTLCRAAGVTVRLVGGTGAMGTMYNTFEMVNTGRQACHTQGYAGIGLFGADGKPAPVTMSRDPHSTLTGQPEPVAQPVTLTPGSAALFTVTWGDRPAEGQSSCPGYTRLIVTPPDDTANTTADLGTYFPTGLSVCGNTVGVQPLAAEPIRCDVAQLAVKLVSVGPIASSPGQGSAFMSVTNTGTSQCRMFGWPGLQFLSPSGAELPTTANRVGGPPQLVVLAPTNQAYISFNWQTGCPNTIVAAQLKITPPDGLASTTISATPNATNPQDNGVIAACQGQVQLQPVT